MISKINAHRAYLILGCLGLVLIVVYCFKKDVNVAGNRLQIIACTNQACNAARLVNIQVEVSDRLALAKIKMVENRLEHSPTFLAIVAGLPSPGIIVSSKNNGGGFHMDVGNNSDVNEHFSRAGTLYYEVNSNHLSISEVGKDHTIVENPQKPEKRIVCYWSDARLFETPEP